MDLMTKAQDSLLAKELRDCNAYSRQFGLALTESDIQELAAGRRNALKAAGRVEFGSGILPKLIRAFCDSPYIDRESYPSVLAELQEAFYCFKSDALEAFTDDEIIEFMAAVFHGRARGSTDYLIGTSLHELCRQAHHAFQPDEPEEEEEPF